MLLGGTGSGRTSIIARLHAELGREAAQYIDLERAATTPERFAHALVHHSPFVGGVTNGDVVAGTRAAFDRALTLAPAAYETRYRLATAHARLGHAEEAARQLDLFERARREALERRRRDIARDVEEEETGRRAVPDQGAAR